MMAFSGSVMAGVEVRGEHAFTLHTSSVLSCLVKSIRPARPCFLLMADDGLGLEKIARKIMEDVMFCEGCRREAEETWLRG